jgi:hypothetical protein
VFQVADPVADVALARQRLGFIDQRLPARRGLAHLGALGIVAREGIQQRQLEGRDSRACCSCWPWISTSMAASSVSWTVSPGGR